MLYLPNNKKQNRIMDFKDLSPEDQQAIIERVKRARTETPTLLKEGRYADAFDLVYYTALIDPESTQLAVRIALQKEGIHLLRPDQIEVLRLHADENRPLAQYLYGYWLWNNRKNVKGIDRVIELMEKASKWGIGDASYCLSCIYNYGEAFEIDKEKSDYYYSLAGKQEMNFKWFISKIRDHIYGRRGEEEDPQTTITILRDIIGLPKDTDLRWQTERVKELETEAAKNAHPLIWNLLYECYDALGIAWAGEIYAQMGIDQGDYGAYLDLIRCRCTDYKDEEGKLLDNKLDEYRRILRIGAEAGSSEMMYRLGLNLSIEYDNEGTSEERRTELQPEIRRWYERASQLGNGEASEQLALAYFMGDYGFEQNQSEAWNHFHRAAIQGQTSAYYSLYLCAAAAHDESVPEEDREFHLPPDADPLTPDEWEALGRTMFEAAGEPWPEE